MSAVTHESDDLAGLRTRAEQQPFDPIAHRLLAEGLDAAGQYEASLAAYRRALDLSPADVESIAGIARLCVWRLQRPGDAREPCLAFIRQNSPLTPLLVYIWLAQTYQHDVTADIVWQALQQDLGGFGDARLARQGLATALYREGSYDEARTVAEALLEADAVDPVGLPLIAAIIADTTHDVDRADEHYWRAVCAHPRNRAVVMAWLTHLSRRGEPERGHAFLRELMQSPEYSQMTLSGTRLWDGSSPRGKRMILDCTMGLGDCIQFSRFATVLHDDGGIVTIHCAEPLHPLVRTVRGVSHVVTPVHRTPGDWFLHPVASCALLNRSAASLGALCPYIHATPESLARWAPEIPRTPRLRVGLTWASSAYLDRANKYKFRSMTFENVLPLLDVPGVDFYSLQCGEANAALRASDVRDRVRDLGDRFKDFMDTAAVMTHMDLMIVVDTAAAHVAGALGRPTFMALPYAPSFRWLVKGSHEPWYPTMTVFRQRVPGGWADPIAEMREALAAMAAARATTAPATTSLAV